MSFTETIDRIIQDLQQLKHQTFLPATPILPPHYKEFLDRFKIVIHATTAFERKLDFNNPYVHLFHSQVCPPEPGSMMLVGMEDRAVSDEPADGWTDILFPVFYAENFPEANACQTKEGVFYVDLALSGAYEKEVWFFTQNKYRLLFKYSVQRGGLFYEDSDIKVSVGYIEYCPVLDRLCNYEQ